MQVSPTVAILLVAMGAAFAAFGAIATLRFLIGDRSKGRARCPKCWYSLQGIAPVDTPGASTRRCPECGYVATREQDLFRSHRPRRLVVLGVFSWLAAGAVSFPVWRDDTLTAQITPTWLLARIAPVHFGPHSPLQTALRRELENRAGRDALTKDHIAVFARRMLSVPGAAGQHVAIPKTLRRNAPCRLIVKALYGMSAFTHLDDDFIVRARLAACTDGRPGDWIWESAYFLRPPDRCVSGIPIAGGAVSIELEVRSKETPVWRGAIAKSVEWREGTEPILEPDSRPLDQLLTDMPRVYLGGVDQPPVVSMVPPPAITLGQEVGDVGFGITVQVLHDDRVVAGGEYVPPLRWHSGRRGNDYRIPRHVELHWIENPPTHIAPGDQWKVRFIGNEELAAMDFDTSSLRPQPAPTKYWAGTHDFAIDKLVDLWRPE